MAKKKQAGTERKYGYLCRDCEVTQRVDTLTGEESRRVWFSEPWRCGSPLLGDCKAA